MYVQICVYVLYICIHVLTCMYVYYVPMPTRPKSMYVCMVKLEVLFLYVICVCMYVWIMTVSFILSLFVGVQLRHELQWRLRHSRRQWRLQHEHQRHHHLHQTAQKCVSQPVGVYPDLLDPSSCGIPHRLPYFLMQVTFAHTFILPYLYVHIYIHTHTYTYTFILPYLHVHTYIHIHIFTSIFSCTYIHIYIHTYIHMYIQFGQPKICAFIASVFHFTSVF